MRGNAERRRSSRGQRGSAARTPAVGSRRTRLLHEELARRDEEWARAQEAEWRHRRSLARRSLATPHGGAPRAIDTPPGSRTVPAGALRWTKQEVVYAASRSSADIVHANPVASERPMSGSSAGRELYASTVGDLQTRRLYAGEDAPQSDAAPMSPPSDSSLSDVEEDEDVYDSDSVDTALQAVPDLRRVGLRPRQRPTSALTASPKSRRPRRTSTSKSSARVAAASRRRPASASTTLHSRGTTVVSPLARKQKVRPASAFPKVPDTPTGGLDAQQGRHKGRPPFWEAERVTDTSMRRQRPHSADDAVVMGWGGSSGPPRPTSAALVRQPTSPSAIELSTTAVADGNRELRLPMRVRFDMAPVRVHDDGALSVGSAGDLSSARHDDDDDAATLERHARRLDELVDSNIGRPLPAKSQLEQSSATDVADLLRGGPPPRTRDQAIRREAEKMADESRALRDFLHGRKGRLAQGVSESRKAVNSTRATAALERIQAKRPVKHYEVSYGTVRRVERQRSAPKVKALQAATRARSQLDDVAATWAHTAADPFEMLEADEDDKQDEAHSDDQRESVASPSGVRKLKLLLDSKEALDALAGGLLSMGPSADLPITSVGVRPGQRARLPGLPLGLVRLRQWRNCRTRAEAKRMRPLGVPAADLATKHRKSSKGKRRSGYKLRGHRAGVLPAAGLTMVSVNRRERRAVGVADQIQAAFRGNRVRVSLALLSCSARVLQRSMAEFHRRQQNRRLFAVSKIQAIVIGDRVRRGLIECHVSALMIQVAARDWLLYRRQRAAIVIQAAERRRQAIDFGLALRELRDAAIGLQRVYRGFVAKTTYQKQKIATSVVQRAFRLHVAHMRLKASCATAVQRIWRGRRAWREFQKVLKAVTLVQSVVRAWKARLAVDGLRATKIRAEMRRMVRENKAVQRAGQAAVRQMARLLSSQEGQEGVAEEVQRLRYRVKQAEEDAVVKHFSRVTKPRASSRSITRSGSSARVRSLSQTDADGRGGGKVSSEGRGQLDTVDELDSGAEAVERVDSAESDGFGGDEEPDNSDADEGEDGDREPLDVVVLNGVFRVLDVENVGHLDCDQLKLLFLICEIPVDVAVLEADLVENGSRGVVVDVSCATQSVHSLRKSMSSRFVSAITGRGAEARESAYDEEFRSTARPAFTFQQTRRFLAVTGDPTGPWQLGPGGRAIVRAHPQIAAVALRRELSSRGAPDGGDGGAGDTERDPEAAVRSYFERLRADILEPGETFEERRMEKAEQRKARRMRAWKSFKQRSKATISKTLGADAVSRGYQHLAMRSLAFQAATAARLRARAAFREAAPPRFSCPSCIQTFATELEFRGHCQPGHAMRMLVANVQAAASDDFAAGTVVLECSDDDMRALNGFPPVVRDAAGHGGDGPLHPYIGAGDA